MQTRALSHFSLANPRVLVTLLALISIMPLLVPAFPPLTDVPGHLGRYAVQIAVVNVTVGIASSSVIVDV